MDKYVGLPDFRAHPKYQPQIFLKSSAIKGKTKEKLMEN